VRPEQGLLALRRALGVYANLRPVAAYPALAGCSPIRRSFLRGVNMLVVRELAGGIYFGGKVRAAGAASDTCSYSTGEIERVARVACRMAQGRRCKLTSVDKANVLETSRLWRLTVERVVRDEFPNVRLEHLLVDAAAMHIIRRPADFDVIVTENMFGDILTDEASVLAGSPGMLPSASLGDNSRGLFEPAHGSAPDIASKGIANPYGAILSAGMMLEHSLGLHKEADAVEAAVRRAIRAGVVTPDIAGKGAGPASTVQAGDAVIDGLRSRLLPCRR
jgi:3-isopropylmalate dehydrogenase